MNLLARNVKRESVYVTCTKLNNLKSVESFHKGARNNTVQGILPHISCHYNFNSDWSSIWKIWILQFHCNNSKHWMNLSLEFVSGLRLQVRPRLIRNFLKTFSSSWSSWKSFSLSNLFHTFWLLLGLISSKLQINRDFKSSRKVAKRSSLPGVLQMTLQTKRNNARVFSWEFGSVPLIFPLFFAKNAALVWNGFQSKSNAKSKRVIPKRNNKWIKQED